MKAAVVTWWRLIFWQWKERKNDEEVEDRMVLKKAGEAGEVEVRGDETRREPHRETKCLPHCLPLSSLQTQCTWRAHTQTHTIPCSWRVRGVRNEDVLKSSCHSISTVPEASEGNSILRNPATKLSSMSQWIKDHQGSIPHSHSCPYLNFYLRPLQQFHPPLHYNDSRVSSLFSNRFDPHSGLPSAFWKNHVSSIIPSLPYIFIP